MWLVERDGDLSTLGELFSSCVKGKGRIAVVGGPVASGKTALLHRFAEQATASGALFLSGTASRSEGTLPLGLISQIFRSPELSGAAAESTMNQLLESATLDLTAQDLESNITEHMPVAVMNRLWKFVHDLARRVPLVIGVDDVQHADRLSLQVLMYFFRRSKSVRVLFVLNECACPQDKRLLFDAELHSQPHCHRLRLEALSQSGVEQLTRQYVDGPTAQRLAPVFHRVSGGNPLLARALNEDNLGHSEPLPGVAGETFGQGITACLYRCDPFMIRVARAIAVLGDSTPRALLCEVLDSDGDSVARSVRALEAVGLLDGGRFRHEAKRAAALTGVPAYEVAALHDRAARALHENGTEARVVARHLVEVSGLDAPWMVTALQDAADQEMMHGDLSLAARYLRLARQACTDERQRALMTSALAGAEWQIEPATIVRLLPELIKATDQGHLTGQAVTKLLTYLFWHGHTSQALDVITRLGFGSPQLADAANDSHDNSKLMLSWLYPPLLQHVQDPDAARAEVQSREISLVNAIIDGEEVDDNLLIAAEQVLLGARLDDAVLSPIMASLAALVYTDSLDRAASWCGPLLKAAEKRGARTWHALLSTIHSIIDVRRGALHAAGEHARRALTLISPQSWGVAIGLPLASMVLTATEMGNYEEAASFLDIPVPAEMYETVCGLYYIRARGRYHVAIGRLHTALADFQSCGRIMREWGVDQPALIPWRSDAAHACLGLGRTAQARRLVDEQLSMIGPMDHRTRGGSLRLLAQISQPAERRSLLTTAVAELELSGDRVELALALAGLSQSHRALGKHQQAQEVIQRVDMLAEQCGAEPIRTSRQPASPVADRIELSEAEQRVASLAAEGYTNRRIARELYITVSTVEQHLTRVYRKLKVNRRVDLSDALGSC